jgi:hypothetical protein
LIVQGVDPPRRPDLARRFGGQRDVAEVFQRRQLRALLIGAVGHPLVGGDRQVRANLFLEVLVVPGPPPFQPGKDRHQLLLARGDPVSFGEPLQHGFKRTAFDLKGHDVESL